MEWLTLRRFAVWLLMVFAACSGSMGNSATSATGAGGAITNVTVGAALWAVGKGCNMQGCPYGSYCNKATGFCATRTCLEGCPENTTCNEGLNRCQDPAPAAPPSDFLPQDIEKRRINP